MVSGFVCLICVLFSLKHTIEANQWKQKSDEAEGLEIHTRRVSHYFMYLGATVSNYIWRVIWLLKFRCQIFTYEMSKPLSQTQSSKTEFIMSHFDKSAVRASFPHKEICFSIFCTLRSPLWCSYLGHLILSPTLGWPWDFVLVKRTLKAVTSQF